MALTINKTEVKSQGKPPSSPQGFENKSGSSSGTSPRSNPVCLEITVSVRGLPGETGDSSGSAGPIREQGRTVIVFDNGAVLRLSNNLPSGQKIILSNAQGRDVVCRVVNGRNLPSVKGYVEVEFVEQVEDFWRIHQVPEPASASPDAPGSGMASIQPNAVVPTVAPLVTPRTATFEKQTSGASGSAPTFDDIAGLVRMSPPATATAKVKPPVAQAATPKPKTEVRLPQDEPAKPVEPTFTAASDSDVTLDNLAADARQDFSSALVQKSSSSNNFMASGMLAPAQTTGVSSSDGVGRRTPLVLGGVALVLAGFGAAYFYMHQGGAATPAGPAAMAIQSSAPLPHPQRSEVQPVQPPQHEVEHAAADAQPAGPIANVKAETSDFTSSDTHEAQINRKQATSDAIAAQSGAQSSRATKQREQLQSLKMRSPSAPKQDMARLSDGAAPSVTDLTSAAAVGGATPNPMVAPAVRTGNQPAPPSWLTSSTAPSSKTVLQPKLLSSTNPVYPQLAKQSNTQGTVVVVAEVDLSGNISSAKAISGPTSLRQAAIDAVRRWKYLPALIDGKPATAQVTVNVQFHLN